MGRRTDRTGEQTMDGKRETEREEERKREREKERKREREKERNREREKERKREREKERKRERENTCTHVYVCVLYMYMCECVALINIFSGGHIYTILYICKYMRLF